MAEGMNVAVGYLQSDTDTANLSPQYYGFINTQGSWYISQYTSSAGVSTFRYFAGSGLTSYQSSWAGRAGLSYDYFSNIFSNP